jgi:hypothetical protein
MVENSASNKVSYDIGTKDKPLIKLKGKEIGKGAYSQVKRGVFEGNSVAVKIHKTDEDSSVL